MKLILMPHAPAIESVSDVNSGKVLLGE